MEYQGQTVAYCMYGDRSSEIYIGLVVGFTATKVKIQKDNDLRFTYDENYTLKKPGGIVIIEDLQPGETPDEKAEKLSQERRVKYPYRFFVGNEGGDNDEE